MKYLKLLLISICLLPINVMAYSDYVIMGGDNIGISIDSDGLLVTNFYKINNKYNYNGLKIGDYITHVNGIEVDNTNDFINLIKDKTNVNLSIRRDNKVFDISFNIIDNKTGLYLKEGITGIGTLTYVDPETNIFGALGHEIVESSTKEKIVMDDGNIFKSVVSGIDRSVDGRPGTKNAKFYFNDVYGEIEKNTKVGIYGEYKNISNSDLVEVGTSDDIKTGKAYIVTTVDNSTKYYEIKISKIDKKSDVKNIYFEIIDEDLIDKTGGIVQGMSGSPIVQNERLVGAVTHVVVDNVKKGYGIFITTMLEEGEK